MRPDRRASLIVAGSVVAMWTVAIWAISRGGDRVALWLAPVAVVTALWAAVHGARLGLGDEGKRQSMVVFLRHFVAWLALSIASLILVQGMATLDGAASAWASGGQRASGLILAFGLILFGNAVPALPAPGTVDRRAVVAQRVRRFVGWTVVLTGLGLGAAWVAMEPASASRVTNRLLALCFFLICARQFASLWDRPAAGSPT